MKTDEELKDELFSVWTDVQYALPVMYNHIVKRRFRTVLELGVRNAVSTRAILLALKKTNGHLWSVDIRACNRGISAVKEWRLDNIWTFMKIPFEDAKKILKEMKDILNPELVE